MSKPVLSMGGKRGVVARQAQAHNTKQVSQGSHTLITLLSRLLTFLSLSKSPVTQGADDGEKYIG
ncbi:hypothetical protein [Marinagarivorans algicola]|uniref:hypothetical protein n=1 Tax=Marinagarivorans algicola TaxID=1513270 RepID=UPI0012E317EA|nr:hypothetical protein [Marinagarivorans algicola]